MGKKSKQKWINRELKIRNQELRIKKKKKIAKFLIIFLLVLGVLGGGGFWAWRSHKGKNKEKIKDNEIAVIETNKGIIKFRLFRSVAPKTVENFIKLANQGFYNGIKFHRVIEDFMIQTGDPLTRDDSKKEQWGTGGPGYKFEDEINPWYLGLDDQTIKLLQDQGYVYDRKLKSLKNTVGAVSMANSGPNTNGSQFFIITHSDQPHLDGRHTVFGKVIVGMDVVRKIAAVETDERDRPIEDIVMEKVYIVTTEKEDNKEEEDKEKSSNLKIETIENKNIDIEDLEVETE